MDDLRQFAKDRGLENLLDELIGGVEVTTPKERPTKAEAWHRKRRKVKNKTVKVSRRKNRR